MAKKIGFGQVEPNHLSGIVEGRIYAQLPAASALGTILEQGTFACYDLADGEVNFDTTHAPLYMIYNEEKHYDEREFMHRDFAMKSTEQVGGVMVPRLIAIEVGDIFTTNTFAKSTSKDDEVTITLPAKDAAVYVDKTTGLLTTSTTNKADAPVFNCVKVTTLPDGQDAVKLQRIS